MRNCASWARRVGDRERLNQRFPSEVSALASGIVMPVQGNRSHASSKLQVTICSLLHPKKSMGIMYARMALLSGKLNWVRGPLLAERRRSECLSLRCYCQDKEEALLESLSHGGRH